MKQLKAIAAVVLLVASLMSTVALAEEVAADSTGMTKTVKADAFKGSVKVSIVNKGKIELGDTVTLKAKVKGAKGIAVEINWEVNDGTGWTRIAGETGAKMNFQVTEGNAGCQWRAVAITEA